MRNKKASQVRYNLTRFADSVLRGIQYCLYEYSVTAIGVMADCHRIR